MNRPIFAALAAALALAAPADAQSLFGTRGLGVPAAPLDARAQVLGGSGVGLLGTNPSMVNPAEVAGVGLRGISAALQPVRRATTVDGRSDAGSATRFPLIRILYPVQPRLALSAGYGAFFDQNWGVRIQGEETLDGRAVPTEDVLQATGGIAQFQLGAAYAVTERLAVGVAGGVYTGDLERSTVRSFPGSGQAELQSFEQRATWRYRGPLAVVGARWDPTAALRVGGSVTWSGDLEVRGVEGAAAGGTVSMPLQLAFGASSVLAPRLTAALSGRWAGWSVAAEQVFPSAPVNDFGRGAADGTQIGVPGPAAVDAWELGGGVEWAGGRAGERSFPVRVGARFGRLPFTILGETPSEWAAAVGFGARLAPTDFGPLAVADAALERGGRSAAVPGGLEESFWRLTLSMTLFGR
jgi:hypothetical protein